jgi:hypothetical protein
MLDSSGFELGFVFPQFSYDCGLVHTAALYILCCPAFTSCQGRDRRRRSAALEVGLNGSTSQARVSCSSSVKAEQLPVRSAVWALFDRVA